MDLDTPPPQRPSARERLLAAADELFYAEGVNTVGIDRIIARADVAKASLYDSFGSKEGLVRAYLEARANSRQARLLAGLAAFTTPRARLLGVFDVLAEVMAAPSYRGCAFVRASAETRSATGVRGVCDDSRAWMVALFEQLAAEAGVAGAGALARQLMLVYDGAAVAALMDHDAAAARTARAVAELLLDAALAAGSAPR